MSQHSKHEHPDTGNTHPHAHTTHRDKHNPYLGLLISLAASYAAMYLIMYAMADRWSNVYVNLSNVYMTGLMAGSMLPIMLLTMRGMFKNTRANLAVWAASVVILAGSWFLLRAEAGVGDRQFLRAMIPHHSAAIQMCEESAISDPRIRKLCGEIVESQKREIEEMKTLLRVKR